MQAALNARVTVGEDRSAQTQPLGVDLVGKWTVHAAGFARRRYGVTAWRAVIPAVMRSLTWQWNIQTPGLSGVMFAATVVAGSRLAVSRRRPATSAVLSCQCGVCRTACVPRAIRYQCTRSPAFLNQPVAVPRLRPDLAALIGAPGQRPDIVMRFGCGLTLPMSPRRPVEDVHVQAKKVDSSRHSFPCC